MDFLKNIFGSGSNIFGAGSNIDTEAYKQAGLLNQADIDKAGNQSLMRGLLGAGMSYLAQPQNKGYGTITPYLGKALQEGMTQAQKPYDNLTSNIEQTRKLQEYKEAEEQEQRMKDFRAGYGKNNMKVTVNKPGGVDSRLQKTDQNGNVTQVAPDFNAPEETQEEIEWFSKQKYLLKALQNNTISLEDYEKYSALPEGFTLKKDEVRYERDANGNLKAIGNVGNKWAEAGQATAEGMISTINEDYKEYEKLQGITEKLEDPNFKYFEGNFSDWKESVAKFFQGEGATNWSPDDWDEYLANTENLNAMLQMDVFRAIKDLGIGARGLDTPAERDFLIKVMTGNASVSRDALIQLTRRRRDKAKDKLIYLIKLKQMATSKAQKVRCPAILPVTIKQ